MKLADLQFWTPTPSHLSPAQLDRQLDLTMEVLLQYALVGRVENNLAHRYPDFTPSLTRDDVYGILHATTNADDQKAINALIERIDQMGADAHGGQLWVRDLNSRRAGGGRAAGCRVAHWRQVQSAADFCMLCSRANGE